MHLPRTLLIALGLLLLAAAPAHAARGMEVAISDEEVMVDGTDGNPLVAYQAAKALNATRMRIIVQWARVSDAADTTPSPDPDYNWAPIDNAVDAAAAYGMRTQLVLAGPAPAYGAGLFKSLRVKWPKPQLYADFAGAAAAHFKGRVDRYSIWNEPNYPAWIAPQKQSPKIYRALYEAGYQAIKSADPRAKVLIGETVPYGGKVSRKLSGLATPPLAWLRTVACVDAHYKPIGHCAPLKADGYAHHPYEFTMAPTARAFPGADNAPIQALGRLQAALKKLAQAHALTTASGKAPDIYLTESGYFVSGKRKVPSAKRALWLPQQFQVAAAQPGVREMLQYNMFVPSDTTFTTGLFSLAGPALPEYRTLLSWTRGAARTGLIKPNTGPIDLPPAPAAPTTDATSGTAGGGGGGGDAATGPGGTGAPAQSSQSGLSPTNTGVPACKIAIGVTCVVAG
jgi:hypothetical protein